MVLTPDLLDGNQPESHGIGVNMIPGDPRFQIELQRAPDNGAGAPGAFATIQQLPPLPGAMTYVDLIADDGAFRHYRWRHIAPGYDPSTNWSPVGRGKPTRLEGPAAGGGLISLYPIVREKPLSDGRFLFGKTLVTDPDNHDSIVDGATYGRLFITARTQAFRRPGSHSQQMLPNAGFEDGLVFVIKNGGNAVAVITDSTKAHSGNKYLEVTSTTGVQTNAVAADDAGVLRTFEVQPGDVVQFGGFAYRESGTDNVRYLLQARDKDNGFVSNNVTTPQNTAAWLLTQGQYIVPAGVKYVTIFADVDGSGTATVGRFDDWFTRIAFATSTVHNPQGSILPVPFGASLFTGSWGGLGAGQMFVAFSWASQTLLKPDASSVTLPAPPAALAAPTLTQQAGGVRGATTLFARIGLFKDGHLEALSAESSLAVLANNVLKIARPANPGGYDSWMPLVGNATNAEYVQASGSPPNSGPLDFGTDYVEPNAHFTTLDTQYAAAMLGALVYLDLQPSTTYYFYPFYDFALGFARFAPFGFAVGITAPSMANANQAWSDGRIALSGSGMAITIGVGGGSGSPTTGGSRLT